MSTLHITTVDGLTDSLDAYMACACADPVSQMTVTSGFCASKVQEMDHDDRHNLNGEIAKCFVRYANRYADNRGRKHCLRSMKRAVKRCSIQAHDASGACGLFLIDDWIIAGVLEWCLGKALDWLWNWYFSAPEMAVQSIACGLGAWQEEDSDDE